MGLEDFKKKGSGVGTTRAESLTKKFKPKTAAQKASELARLDKMYDKGRAMMTNPVDEEYERRVQAGEIEVPPVDD